MRKLTFAIPTLVAVLLLSPLTGVVAQTTTPATGTTAGTTDSARVTTIDRDDGFDFGWLGLIGLLGLAGLRRPKTVAVDRTVHRTT